MDFRNDNIFGDSIAQQQSGAIAKTFISNLNVIIFGQIYVLFF